MSSYLQKSSLQNVLRNRSGQIDEKSPEISDLGFQKPPEIIKKYFHNPGTNKFDYLYAFQLLLKKFPIRRPLILSLWPVFREFFTKIDLEASTELNFKTLPQNLLKILPKPFKNLPKKHVDFWHRIFYVLPLYWMIWGSTMRNKFVFCATFGYPGLTLAALLAHLAPRLLIFNPIMENLAVWELIWRAFWSLKVTIWKAWKHINLILKWDNSSWQWIDLKTESIHFQSPEFKLIHFQSTKYYDLSK